MDSKHRREWSELYDPDQPNLPIGLAPGDEDPLSDWTARDLDQVRRDRAVDRRIATLVRSVETPTDWQAKLQATVRRGRQQVRRRLIVLGAAGCIASACLAIVFFALWSQPSSLDPNRLANESVRLFEELATNGCHAIDRWPNELDRGLVQGCVRRPFLGYDAVCYELSIRGNRAVVVVVESNVAAEPWMASGLYPNNTGVTVKVFPPVDGRVCIAIVQDERDLEILVSASSLT